MIILNVDDDDDDREVFCDAIKHIDAKITCHTEKDAENALNYLNTRTPLPNLIFLDINMPKCNGTECLLIIKQDKRLTDIPVVMYSTTASPADLHLYKMHNAKFMSKASRFDEMIVKMREVIAEARA